MPACSSIIRALLLLGAFGLAPTRAWDDVGHAIIGQIAYDQLNEPARRAVDRLAAQVQGPRGAYDAITIGWWMDDIRSDAALPDYRRFLTWHYIDISLDPRDPLPSFEPGADNDVHGNALQGIKRALVVLRGGHDPYVSGAPMALAMVEHLTGDLHQPLHCATKFFFFHGRRIDDRGGNDELVVNGPPENAKFNLHAFWDSAYRAEFDPAPGSVLLDPANRDRIRDLAAESRSATLAPSLITTDVDAWARESNGIAKEVVYRDLMMAGSPKYCRLSSAYVDKARLLARGRLGLAGARLARLLNETLGAGAPPAPPPAHPPAVPAPATGE